MHTSIPRSYDELEAELQKPVITWNPKKYADQPRVVFARVEDRYQVKSDYTDKDGNSDWYPVLALADERSATVWVRYCSATALRGKVERLDPRIGDLIGLAFVGVADEKDDKSAERWNLKIIERAAGDITADTSDFVPPEEEGGDGIPF
jgi:hypothetical protein